VSRAIASRAERRRREKSDVQFHPLTRRHHVPRRRRWQRVGADETRVARKERLTGDLTDANSRDSSHVAAERVVDSSRRQRHPSSCSARHTRCFVRHHLSIYLSIYIYIYIHTHTAEYFFLTDTNCIIPSGLTTNCSDLFQFIFC